jgi:hypothetical protein
MYYFSDGSDFGIPKFQNPGPVDNRVELTKFRRDGKYK